MDSGGFRNICFTGPPLNDSLFLVAVNWSGILFMDGKDRKLLEVPYLKIKQVHTR